MRIIETSVSEFRAKAAEAGVPVRVIRTRSPEYRVVGNQVAVELVVVIQYLADVVAPDGEVEMWTCTETRPVDAQGEADLADLLYESLPNVTFVKRSGTF
ncbi:MAG: hypothetical protein U0324_07685 [Polyangiales bacterium]